MVNTAPWNLKSSYGCIDKPPGTQLQPVAFKWIQCPHRKGSWSMVSLEGIFGEWLWNMSNAKLRWAVLVEPIVAYVKLEHTQSSDPIIFNPASHHLGVPPSCCDRVAPWKCDTLLVVNLPEHSTQIYVEEPRQNAHKFTLNSQVPSGCAKFVANAQGMWHGWCRRKMCKEWPLLKTSRPCPCKWSWHVHPAQLAWQGLECAQPSTAAM